MFTMNNQSLYTIPLLPYALHGQCVISGLCASLLVASYLYPWYPFSANGWYSNCECIAQYISADTFSNSWPCCCCTMRGSPNPPITLQTGLGWSRHGAPCLCREGCLGTLSKDSLQCIFQRSAVRRPCPRNHTS